METRFDPRFDGVERDRSSERICEARGEVAERFGIVGSDGDQHPSLAVDRDDANVRRGQHHVAGRSAVRCELGNHGGLEGSNRRFGEGAEPRRHGSCRE